MSGGREGSHRGCVELILVSLRVFYRHLDVVHHRHLGADWQGWQLLILAINASPSSIVSSADVVVVVVVAITDGARCTSRNRGERVLGIGIDVYIRINTLRRDIITTIDSMAITITATSIGSSIHSPCLLSWGRLSDIVTSPASHRSPQRWVALCSSRVC